MKQYERIIELDILRAIALLLVMGRHSGVPYAESKYVLLMLSPFKIWFALGWTGVDFFFVLSGFLVSGLIFREYQRHSTFDYLRFLIRRGLKIYPAFYFFIIFSSIVNILILSYYQNTIGIYYPSFKRLVTEILYVQNYYIGLWGHTWSLAVEEHFYLLLAALSAFLIRFNSRTHIFQSIPYLLFGIILCVSALRIYLTHCTDIPISELYRPSHLRFDSLFFGVLISYWYHFNYKNLKAFIKKHYRMIRAVSILMLVPCMIPQFTNHRYLNSIQLTLLFLSYGSVILLALFWEGKRKVKILNSLKFLATIGRHSYSIYLWHFAVALWLKTITNSNLSYLSYLTIYMIASISIGIFFSILLEQRVLKIRDFYFPSKT